MNVLLLAIYKTSMYLESNVYESAKAYKKDKSEE